MKKVLMVSIAFAVMLVGFSSCTTTGVYDASEEVVVKEQALSVSVDGVIEKHTFMLYGFSLVSNQGVSVTMENTGDGPVVVNWDTSSISYGNNTSSVFISGQKFITAGTSSVPPLTIPQNGTKSVDIYPADNVSWNESAMDWKIGNMGVAKGETITLSINYDYEGQNKFFTVKTSPKNGSFKWGF